MKKLVGTLIFLFALYIGIQYAFVRFGKGENYSYEIEKDGLVFGVNEVSSFNKNIDNYHFNIFVNEKEFIFSIDYNFNKMPQVIIDFEYFKNDSYECILPIYKDNTIVTDIICDNNGELTYYYNLAGKDSDLDKFAYNLKLYDINKFKDVATSSEIESVNIYIDNLIKNHYVDFTNYKGIFNISKNFNSVVYKINLYKSDVRNQKVGAFCNQYYISADYNQEFEFNEFNVVDLVRLDNYKIISDNKISLDSYIQGVVDNKIYLYDKDNKKQYEINIENKSVVETSSSIIKYYNNEWTTMTIAQANNELKFVSDTNDYNNSKYSRIDKINSTYYLYLKNNNSYKVYKTADKENLIYLFSTDSIDNIDYTDNYVYFISGSEIKVYNDQIGVKRIASYDDLKFNQNVNFNVYSK